MNGSSDEEGGYFEGKTREEAAAMVVKLKKGRVGIDELERNVSVVVALSPLEALCLAQMVTRIGFHECLLLSTSPEEAIQMREGCHQIRESLKNAGYDVEVFGTKQQA